MTKNAVMSIRDIYLCISGLPHISTTAMFVWLISHQPAVLFSQNKSAVSNQPTVLFSQNKPAPAISHQPTEQADSNHLQLQVTYGQQAVDCGVTDAAIRAPHCKESDAR
jgi:hypothetical protein